MIQGFDWSSLENSLKTGARFFSRTAADHLTSLLDGIGELQTREGRALVVDAGPGTGLRSLYRARVYQSDAKLEATLGRPDIHLGSPSASLAAAGRMNARGISVFYGANNQKAAIAEVRPPVGSQIVIAQFEIARRLRLLDLTALGDVLITESLADFELPGRMEGAVFLRSLSGRITRPTMPDDEPLDYVATQVVADFLSEEASIDGIIYPSVQAAGDAVNVVLFHKAARVEAISVPAGTEISVSTGRWAEDGWAEEYEVLESVPTLHRQEQAPELPDLVAISQAMPLDPRDADWRHDSLRIVPESVEVHRVKRVEFATDGFTVKRLRRENVTAPIFRGR